jgi:hypothetical protein
MKLQSNAKLAALSDFKIQLQSARSKAQLDFIQRCYLGDTGVFRRQIKQAQEENTSPNLTVVEANLQRVAAIKMMDEAKKKIREN